MSLRGSAPDCFCWAARQSKRQLSQCFSSTDNALLWLRHCAQCLNSPRLSLPAHRATGSILLSSYASLFIRKQSSCRATIAYDQGIGLLACANSIDASPSDASRSFWATSSGKRGTPPCKSGQLKKDLGLEVHSAGDAARLIIFEIMRSFFVGSSASVPHGTRTILTSRMMRHAASLRVTRGSS